MESVYRRYPIVVAKDFYATDSPQRMIFEVKPGGRLYEDSGNGNGLVWYQVIALNAPNSITMSGFIAPPFGGPATSLLNVSFSAEGQIDNSNGGNRFHIRLFWKNQPRWKAGVYCSRMASSHWIERKETRKS